MSGTKIGFEMRKIKLPLGSILPIRLIKNPENNVVRYKTIRESLRQQGLVEPLVVYPQKNVPQKYLLLNGHLRFHALKELGETTADCIISTDDESFTYNARVNHLPPFQEHKMILRAVRNGVKPERIAAALNMPVRVVLASMRLLDGIHEEAVELLKDKNVTAKAIRMLKRVTGVRQIEIIELMISANNYFTSYVEALVLGTPKNQLVNPNVPKKKEGFSPEAIARMEQEMESLGRDMKTIEETYAENVLNLTLVRAYFKKLLNNAKVVRFLNAYYPDILSECESIIASESL
jgi:hypothetical protein